MAEEKPRKIKASGLPRLTMPEQNPKRRATNFEEVPYGISLEMAMDEASRCLQCPKPRCMAACPVNIRIPEFIAEIAKGDPKEAAIKLKKQTALPAVCGRVCPQENQCEGSCILGIKGKPVAIGALERFSADYVRLNNLEQLPEKAPATGKRVAIIGCGPAGITAAADLAIAGHEVEIFEALHLPGGVLMYGIPQFRLPKEIVVHEVESLKKLGVKIHLNYVVGKLRTVDKLLSEGFDAIFIGSGAGLPMFLGIPGENSVGVFSANEFLTRFNLMKAYDFPNHATTPISAKHIITVGGGNVAMDSSRTALRIGAKSTLVYRRAREQMPARAEEVHHAEQEGVNFQMLTNPKRVIADDSGKIVALECVKMELGEPDASGRRSVVEVEGSEFQIPCDALVIAIGNRPNPLIPMTCDALKTTKKGTLEVDPETLQTSIPQVFAGGDVVSGAATVISAMGQAKIAARSINKFLKGEPLKDETSPASV
ncbi:MAG: NADPH-dependent glutamate synthase [Opitutales bacterium]|nr:NADPH-dependent glutamate synthase [Opitutales bacterium]